MNGRFAALCALSLAVLLSGCVQYKWVKPGVSDTEMNKKLTECEAQALIDLPPDNVVTGSSSEKRTKRTRKRIFPPAIRWRTPMRGAEIRL